MYIKHRPGFGLSVLRSGSGVTNPFACRSTLSRESIDMCRVTCRPREREKLFVSRVLGRAPPVNRVFQ